MTVHTDAPQSPDIGPKAEKKMECFNMRGVTLADSRWKSQYLQTRDFYFQLQNDALLHGFRMRAGVPARGESLPGWYGNDFFNAFGQFLSAFARMYRATGDEEIRRKAVILMDEWVQAVEPDGFFYYSRNPNAPHYGYDKMAGALLDMNEYAGEEKALVSLGRITDWAERHLDRTNLYAHCCGAGSTEWYTLPENLYRAYLATGEERYRALGDQFFYSDYYRYFRDKDFFGLMEAGRRSDWRRYHAYSHVNSLGSFALAYQVSGKSEYLKALVNAHEIIEKTQKLNTGGFGPVETFMMPGQRTESLYAEDFHFETACGSWAAFKMSRYLIELTGEARYGDWAEQMIYNGIGAVLPVKPNGEIMYFSNYNINGAQKETCNPWSCCTGTYPLDVAEYHNQIYYRSAGGIYINLYVPSKVVWERPGNTVLLEQRTQFPAEDRTSILLSIDHPMRFTVGFRKPGWCVEEPVISVNRKAVLARAKKGWIEIEKDWKSGDEITLHLPLRVRAVRLEVDFPYPVAFHYGPVVLVLAGEEKPRWSERELDEIAGTIAGANAHVSAGALDDARGAEEELTFKKQEGNGKKVVFRPFCSIGEGTRYFMYFDPVGKRVSHRALAFGPEESSWKIEGLGHEGMGEITLGIMARISRHPGAFFECTFSGKSVRWVGNQMSTGGTADVFLDGRLVDRVDQYGPITGIPWMWVRENIGDGMHTLRVVVKEERYSGSAGNAINVKHIAVLGGEGHHGGSPDSHSI